MKKQPASKPTAGKESESIPLQPKALAAVAPDWAEAQILAGPSFLTPEAIARCTPPIAPQDKAAPSTLDAGTASLGDVVGHKTFHTPGGGFRHEPLLREEADAILRKCDDEKRQRTELMPEERAAIHMFFQAWQRLKELGWRESMYCPKDGSTFDVIEAGSTGIHQCHYDGEWPKGTYWVHSPGDLWPSHPVLYRSIAAASTQNADGGKTTNQSRFNKICTHDDPTWCDETCNAQAGNQTDGGE